MGQKLKIYTDKRYYTPEKVFNWILQPWEKEFGVSHPTEDSELARYTRNGQEYFERTSLEDCDIAVSPCQWIEDHTNEDIFELAQAAKACGKKVLVFYFSDSEDKVPIDNAIVFRTSLSRSTRTANEFAMPAFFRKPEDFWSKDWEARKKEPKATVGFCGNVDNRAHETNPLKACLKNLGYSIMKRPKLMCAFESFGISITKHKGRKLRTQLLHAFEKSNAVQTNFLVREFFNNGVGRLSPEKQADAALKAKQEYIANTLGSDYILTPRGGGNFSYRFYETLSLGRIPLFLNTDCVLPFEEFINWKDTLLWVEEDELANAPDIAAKVHQQTSEEGFIKKQEACKTLWKEWLSYDGFYKNLWRYLA
tara:strand:+ start:29712 stop:30806 length:1095 start_codon:yes stop_codon:yes gene_type:complete